MRDYLDRHRCDVVVHAATTRSNRRVAAAADLLDRNCRMFFNLARNADRFGKMIHFGSGAEYDRSRLPPMVKEIYFDSRVPADAYGFSKYICAKYIERAGRIVDLRLFGVFGPYEDYTVRFISNACCRVLKGLPIVLRQDIRFDYLYVGDLARITSWFIENDARHKAYNVCTGQPVALTELARMVADISERNPDITVLQRGMGPQYSGDNSRLLAEIGRYQFRSPYHAIAELYDFYKQRESTLNASDLRFDEGSRPEQRHERDPDQKP